MSKHRKRKKRTQLDVIRNMGLDQRIQLLFDVAGDWEDGAFDAYREQLGIDWGDIIAHKDRINETSKPN
jgi:hypothetical protein